VCTPVVAIDTLADVHKQLSCRARTTRMCARSTDLDFLTYGHGQKWRGRGHALAVVMSAR